MSLDVITIIEPTAALSPLVVDSPHSGRFYPADFSYTCALPLLRQTEDFLVDELITGASESGATIITSNFPRSYIDVNRAEDDIDPDVIQGAWPSRLNPSPHTLQGLGLVRRLCRSGVSVYEAPLPVAEVLRRIHLVYQPYHAALKGALTLRKQLFGAYYLLNTHSMPDGENRSGNRRADFVLGDRCGTSCDPAITCLVREILQDMGYSVALNDPYQGVEIVRRYGQPELHQHALQLEINRRLYMDEVRLEKNKNFAKLQNDLTAMFAQLVRTLIRSQSEELAAE
jgi:N-formylglutamate amidohydrolase